MIEDQASGTQLIQDLIADGLSHVARFSPDGDKIMRLHAQTAMIENGFVFLPEEAPWLADYLAELTAFPAGRHDDQVDSTAQALAWAKRILFEPAGPEFWAENLAWRMGMAPGHSGWRERLPSPVATVFTLKSAVEALAFLDLHA